MRLLVLLALPLLASGCMGDPEPDLEETVRLSPAGYSQAAREVDLRLENGAEVQLTFEATGEISWDVHTHEGERVDIVTSGKGAEGSSSFKASRAGTYSVLFQNTRQAPVDVTFRLWGEFERVAAAALG